MTTVVDVIQTGIGSSIPRFGRSPGSMPLSQQAALCGSKENKIASDFPPH